MMRTILDLKNWMAATGSSPEKVAAKVSISNMTIRRLLEKAENSPIPDKYQRQLSGLSLLSYSEHGKGFEPFLEELAKEGVKRNRDLQMIKKEIDLKLARGQVIRELKEKIFFLLNSISQKNIPPKSKAICIGSLLYFLNPFDVVPDAIPMIGYLDDFAVLRLAFDFMRKSKDNANA